MTATTKTELENALLDEYGVESREQLKKTPEWADAEMDNSREEFNSDEEQTVAILRDLNTRVIENHTQQAWFLQDVVFQDYNQETEQFETTGKGIRILNPNGEQQQIGIGRHLGLDPLEPIEIGPMSLKKTVSSGNVRRLTNAEDLNVNVVDHDASLPTPTITETIERLNSLSDGRGVLIGDTPEWQPALCRGVIGDFNDITYFAPGEGEFDDDNTGTLEFPVRDEDGNTITVKADPYSVLTQVNLEVDAHYDDVKETLEGRDVLVFGQGATVLSRQPGMTPFDNRESTVAEIEEWKDAGYIREQRNGRYALEFDPGVPEDERFIEIANTRVYNVEQQADGSWSLGIHHTDIGDNPNVWTYDKNGWNEGAFLAVLGTRVGQDAFSELAAEL